MAAGIVAHAPQISILERAAVCISHGGANTVMESAYHGVPQLVIPLCNDQPIQAYFVEETGIGKAFSPHALTVDACRAALSALIDPDGPHIANVARIRESYRARDGASTAAQLVQKLM